MISRPSRRFRRNTGKAHSRQCEFVDENVDDTDRIIVPHIIFQTVREQCRLPPVFALNETIYSAPLSGIDFNSSMRFHTGWTQRCYSRS